MTSPQATSPWDKTIENIVRPLELIISSNDIKAELRHSIKKALQNAYKRGYNHSGSGYDQGYADGSRRDRHEMGG